MPDGSKDPLGHTLTITYRFALTGLWVTLRKASFCSKCLLIIGVTWSVSQLGPSLSPPPHQSSSRLYSCSRLSSTLQTFPDKRLAYHTQLCFHGKPNTNQVKSSTCSEVLKKATEALTSLSRSSIFNISCCQWEATFSAQSRIRSAS